MKPNIHRLLLNEDENFSGTTTSSLSFPSFSTQNHLPPPPNSPKRTPVDPTYAIDSPMALTVLILVTAFFFIGFFSVYARRLSEETSAEISRRRRNELRQRGAARNPSSPHGLDPAAVRSLPCFAYGLCSKQPLDCAVCLSEFDEKETVKIIPRCGHVYHPHCIDSWLQSHGSCPLCRSTRLFPEEEEEVRLEVPDEMAEGASGEDDAREGRRRCEGERVAALRRTRSWCRRTEKRAVLERSYSF